MGKVGFSLVSAGLIAGSRTDDFIEADVSYFEGLTRETFSSTCKSLLWVFMSICVTSL